MSQSKWAVNRDLFVSFLRTGLLGYGGGPATIPLVHKEVVEQYKWMDDEEFGNILALGNSLPGPILTKMAGYIGYRIGGFIGMVGAVVGAVLPTVLLMIALISFLFSFRESPIVQGMTQAIGPVVGVLLFMLAFNFFMNSKKALGYPVAIALSIVSIIVYVILGWHPVLLIGALIIYALSTNPRKKGE